jgi:hypothetical protein
MAGRREQMQNATTEGLVRPKSAPLQFNYCSQLLPFAAT